MRSPTAPTHTISIKVISGCAAGCARSRLPQEEAARLPHSQRGLCGARRHVDAMRSQALGTYTARHAEAVRRRCAPLRAAGSSLALTCGPIFAWPQWPAERDAPLPAAPNGPNLSFVYAVGLEHTGHHLRLDVGARINDERGARPMLLALLAKLNLPARSL